MNCQELSKVFLFLANNGINPHTKEKIICESKTKRINAIMQLCGFYDEAGEFAFEVGLPGKSGVGGGIIAVLPNHFTITTWSPGLNQKGNSLIGMKALEKFTTKTNLSIF
jgi:glutaminase